MSPGALRCSAADTSGHEAAPMPCIAETKRLKETDRLLRLPVPSPFAGLQIYDGPNHAGLVNTLVEAASRIARGAYDEGIGLAKLVVDEHIARRAKAGVK